MLSIHRPTGAQIRDYLARQTEQPFSYPLVGCTREQPPAPRGWNNDHHRVLLGQGSEVFLRASAAIDTWQTFPAAMTQVFGQDVPRENLVVAVLYRASFFPLWLLMPARVVYTVSDTITRDGHPVQAPWLRVWHDSRSSR